MNVVREHLNASDLTWVFLKVWNKFSRSYLPNSDLTLESTWANEFIIVAQTDGSNTVLVCVVNLPKRARTFNLERADSSVRPTWNDNFICEKRAQRENSSLSEDRASCDHWIIVGVPETNSTILGASRKFVRHTRHEIGVNNCFSVVLTKKHLWEITHSHTVDETFISWC
jgi:hypothetical protein